MLCFHEKDFVHRDLKPENVVFVQRNDLSDIRLIDFGEAIHVEAQSTYNDFGAHSLSLFLSLFILTLMCCFAVGTPCYMAPERFRAHSGAELKKSDVWAIGM